MAPISRPTALFLLAALSAAPLIAQEEDPQAVPNWSASIYWSPVRAPRPLAAPVKGIGEGERPAVHAESVAALPTAPLPFIAITPCRIVDTRGAAGTFGSPALVPGIPRDFPLPTGPCSGIPSNAGAYSLNFTVTNTTGAGDIRVYPEGASIPVVSTLNYLGGQTVANAAIVPSGTSAGISVSTDVHGADLIIDINGYYAAIPPSVSGDTVSTSGKILTPCVDTITIAATVSVALRSRIYASGSGFYNQNGSDLREAVGATLLLDQTGTTVLAGVNSGFLFTTGDILYMESSGFLLSGAVFSNPVFVADPGTYLLRFDVNTLDGTCSGNPAVNGPTLTYLVIAEP